MAFCRLSNPILGTMLLCAWFVSTSVFAQPPVNELVLLNWSEYLDPELAEKFEQQHNVKLREVYFESDDLRDQLILDTNGRGYDLAMVNGAMLEPYVKRGWLAPATEKHIPNLTHIDKKWLNAFPGASGHGVPYFWGTLGIAYRADLVKPAPQSWMDLLEPREQLRGKIAMLDSQRDAMGMALKALGYSANSTNSAQIRQAIELLLAQKPHVTSYDYLVVDEGSALVSGAVAMAMMYSGDALMLQEQHEDIHYVVPSEGSNIWTDYLVVLAGASNPDAAYAFINFLNEPDNAAKLAAFVYCATPNASAKKLMSREYLENPVIYPSENILSKSEAYAPLPPRAKKKFNTAFARLIH